jgi:hypothetical protein
LDKIGRKPTAAIVHQQTITAASQSQEQRFTESFSDKTEQQAMFLTEFPFDAQTTFFDCYFDLDKS